MKQKFNSCFLLLLFVIFLLSSSHVSARLLSTKQGEQIELMKDAPAGDSLLKIESNDSLDNLMGLEDCENGDQECLKRRFLADAHLDYIYTQHHKP